MTQCVTSLPPADLLENDEKSLLLRAVPESLALLLAALDRDCVELLPQGVLRHVGVGETTISGGVLVG